jgi:hypothetical protein
VAPGYVLRQHDIITNFDKVMFLQKLTEAEVREHIPSSEVEEYTDEDEDDKPEVAVQVVNRRRRLSKIPTVPPRRPYRPRYETKKFKMMMARKQPWDVLKPLVVRTKLNVNWDQCYKTF